MNQQQQEQANQVTSMVLAWCYKTLQEDPEIEDDKAFYAARAALNNLPGINKATFFQIWEGSKKELKKPLVLAQIRLVKLESELKSEMIVALQNWEPGSPAETRHWSGVLQHIRHSKGVAFDDALLSVFDCVASDDLKGRLKHCWPEELGGNDE